MVESLVSLEPKALGNIKPWVQGERTPNLVQGALRRSDGKVYRASNVPSAGGSPNYTETGNVRPIHEIGRSEEHTSELQSLMRISYAVFCLKKKTKNTNKKTHIVYIRLH